jgi:glycosyltransferase involved in cell wall biosynthesis
LLFAWISDFFSYLKTLTYFFRHPHPIYFSLEKLFHAVAGKIARAPDGDLFVKEINLPFTSKISTIRRNISFVRSAQSEINHITGDIHYTILGCDKKNLNILTIHDCVLLHRYPKYNPKHWFIKWLWYDLPTKKADAVTVISDNTKQDLLRFTNCPSEKIHLIPDFIDPSFKRVAGNFNSAHPKLLFIGTAPNKNLERTIKAITGLSVDLIIVGYLNETQTLHLQQKNISYRLLNNLTDAAMRDVYAEADIMVFPSVHEGFGLPIIEAQATGRVVLTSKLEPMMSVSGGAACLVDPYDANSIRQGLTKIIENAALRNDLINSGLENVKRFQLDAVTKQYADLYHDLIQKKAG